MGPNEQYGRQRSQALGLTQKKQFKTVAKANKKGPKQGKHTAAYNKHFAKIAEEDSWKDLERVGVPLDDILKGVNNGQKWAKDLWIRIQNDAQDGHYSESTRFIEALRVQKNIYDGKDIDEMKQGQQMVYRNRMDALYNRFIPAAAGPD